MRLIFGKRIAVYRHSFLILLGFWLSPLSPWNDLFTNIPIAYGFGLFFSLFSEILFLPAVIVGYWLSNIAGFVLMHYGYIGLRGTRYSFAKNWRPYVLTTTLYTLLVGSLVYFGVLPSAEELLNIFP